MKVFVSWSGRRSRRIADTLATWLKVLFNSDGNLIDVFVSTQDIRAAARYNEILNAALRDSTFGILCLTPENLNSPWVLFEAGGLSKTAGEGSVCPYLYELTISDLRRPLEQFNAVVADAEGTRRLVVAINSLLQEKKIQNMALNALFNERWRELENKLEEIPTVASDIRVGISRLQLELPNSMSIVKDKKWFSENPFFARVVFDAIDRFKTNLEGTGPYFDVPITLYPFHLVSLLRNFSPIVKAIAVVDAIERFWPQKEGEEILKNTTENSTRVFVFREREHLKANLGVLHKHAQRYNVYALAYNKLAAEFPEFVQDFSIIGGTSAPLLAYYVESFTEERAGLPLKMIRFSGSISELSRHEEAMNGILSISTLVSKDLDVLAESQVDELMDKVFTPEFRELGKKQVEMSAYIEVDQYDEHEENHAYYKEMMEEMIQLSASKRGDTNSFLRVLELGAGTGIFTKRLAQLENVEITALEIDWACFHILKRNMAAHVSAMASRNSILIAENKDNRKYDPPGKFSFIFSSFADHHIFFADKERYLRNICRNLETDGLVIVGDEFLPEHDERDAAARATALQNYHGHIISKAVENGFTALAQLEERALESGLKGWGDCKISCSQYERLVTSAGFEVIHKHKVGPVELDSIGGVYVYAFRKDT
ncbi:MAG TPA: methyltransferase domain-containing protein [Pyrinomonadaceae bacterium]|nr:methyltransferase domain-containing protein [Pyrinomonadaceae bacterium]